MNLKLKQTPGIYLVGFMGSGKSTVGRALAERLGWSFFDIDAEIEQAERQPIGGIFAARGELEFRRIETEAIRRRVASVECGAPAVVALGGGAFTMESNRALLENNGITVWLDCPFETVARRVAGDASRPLAQDPVRFAALYQSRIPGYRLADVHVGIDSDDPAATVEAILAHPLLK
jgi:shikimate kinase